MLAILITLLLHTVRCSPTAYSPKRNRTVYRPTGLPAEVQANARSKPIRTARTDARAQLAPAQINPSSLFNELALLIEALAVAWPLPGRCLAGPALHTLIIV